MRVRPCSITTRLPCVAEGGSFFTAAGTGGDRSPSETMQRYAFPRVRRASASVARGGKRLVFYCFFQRLVYMVENESFLAFARWSLPLVQANRSLRSLKSLILRRRPANPWFHCRPCIVSEFCFSRSFCFFRVLFIFSFVCVVLLDIAPLLRWRSFRGRRQLPQAVEVRRPPARRGSDRGDTVS